MFFVGGGVLHELAHAVAWKRLARIPWSAITVRRSRRKLGLIARIEIPVPASAYRAGVACPVLLMGIAPMLGGLLSGFGLVLLWGAVFFFESFSDIAILLATRRVPATTLVLDRPDRLGCRIVES